MKHMGNKGQGAMEYLMTYGWAILVVMIVGVVLWQLGIFKIGQTTTVTTGWSKLQPLSQTIVYRATGQAFTASFMNTVGTSIKISALTANESISGTTCTATVAGAAVANQTIGAGDTLRVDATCATANKNKGDTYDMVISVTYVAVTGTLATTHTETGNVRGPCEQ